MSCPRDADGDGAVSIECGGPDCDDGDPSSFPGHEEICDDAGHDEDCDPWTFGARDADGDGAIDARCRNVGGASGDDCDDEDPAVSPSAAERCDGRDDDCDGAVDEGVLGTFYLDGDGDGFGDSTAPLMSCADAPGYAPTGDDCDDSDASVHPGASLAAPRAIAPENGALTGSVHAAARGTLRPALRWRVHGDCAATYDVQLDECSPGALADCDFSSVALAASGIAGTSWQPDADLPVSMSAPVGARYAWRVRACSGGVCGDWTSARYVDVGRVAGDLDGDGYSDVVVGARSHRVVEHGEGAVFVYRGGEAGVDPTPITLSDPAHQGGASFGRSVAAVGDLNADGFGDLAVGAPTRDAPAHNEGNVFVYLGGPAGPPLAPTIVLDSPTNGEVGRLGTHLAGAGDVNADGYADLLIGTIDQGSRTWRDGVLVDGAAYIYLGGASGVSASPDVTFDNPGAPEDGFGGPVAGIGDVDADGLADVAVAATDHADAVYIYTGASLATRAPSAVIHTPASPLAHGFGLGLARLGDVDGDGASEMIVGSYVGPFSLGGPPTSTSVPMALAVPADRGPLLGPALSSGDLDGDGWMDIVVGDAARASGGAVLVYLAPIGAGAWLPAPASPTFIESFGSTVASAGDVDGDGDADLLVGATADAVTRTGGVYVFLGTLSGPSREPAIVLGTGVPEDNFGGALAP